MKPTKCECKAVYAEVRGRIMDDISIVRCDWCKGRDEKIKTLEAEVEEWKAQAFLNDQQHAELEKQNKKRDELWPEMVEVVSERYDAAVQSIQACQSSSVAVDTSDARKYGDLLVRCEEVT